jgi:hypothetical protein
MKQKLTGNGRKLKSFVGCVGPTPEGPISHFINFSGEAKNCFLEEKRRFIKKINTTEL